MNSLVCQAPLTGSFVKHFGHLTDIPPSRLERVYRFIARYTARIIDTAQLNQLIKPLSLPLRKAVRSWRSWALSSYYWGNLWRALVARSANEWKAHPDDLELLNTYLRRDDIEQLRGLYFRMPVQRLPREVIDDLFLRLTKWAKCCYRRHLRFITRYDTALSEEDLVATLLVAGIRTLRRYENEGNPTKALNYAKRAIQNEAFNLINRYTRGKRARLVREKNNPDRQYLCRTVSYECLSSILQHEPRPNPLMAHIRAQLGPSYEQYACAILGSADFDEWLSTTYRVRAERLPRQKLQQRACEWAGISQIQLEENLVPLLAEQLQQQPAYFACSMPT